MSTAYPQPSEALSLQGDKLRREQVPEILDLTPPLLGMHILHLNAIRQDMLTILGVFLEPAKHVYNDLKAYRTALDIPMQKEAVASYPEYRKAVRNDSAPSLIKVPNAYRAMLNPGSGMPAIRVLKTALPWMLRRYTTTMSAVIYAIRMALADWRDFYRWVRQAVKECRRNLNKTKFNDILDKCGYNSIYMCAKPKEKYPEELLDTLDKMIKLHVKLSGACCALIASRLANINVDDRKAAFKSGGAQALVKLDYGIIANSIGTVPFTSENEELGFAYLHLRANNYQLWEHLEKIAAGCRERLALFLKDNKLPPGYSPAQFPAKEEMWHDPNACQYDPAAKDWVFVDSSCL